MLTFSPPKTGRYGLTLYATKAPDFGSVQFALDKKPVVAPFDAYSPDVIPSGPLELGTLELAAGPHELRFEITGKNSASSAYKFGVDYLELIELPAAK